MSISFISQSIDYKPNNRNDYRIWLKKVIENEGYKLGEIEYIFVSRESIIEINKNYLDHSFPTDIITFDNSYLRTISGEIFICIELVIENSNEYSKGVFIKELNRVIVHGLLHLLGYKDNTNDARKIMRSKEDFYLKYLD